MKRSNSTFFIIIGLLLVLAGVILLQDDPFIASIGFLIGIYNLVKGIQLYRGVQPLIYRKQEERENRVDDELNDKLDRKK